MLLEAGLRKKVDHAACKQRRNSKDSKDAHLSSFAFYRYFLNVSAVLLLLWLVVSTLFWVTSLSSGDAMQRNIAKGDLAMHNILKNLSVSSYGEGDMDQQDIINFLVVGDYGTGFNEQQEIASAMARLSSQLDPKPSFIISTGDQIYSHGIVSATDPELRSRFEEIYTAEELQVPWIITIGNHDCEGSIDAMLEYAADVKSLWYFPKRYYSFDRSVGTKMILRVIVVDACDLVCGAEPRNTRCNGQMIEQTSSNTRREQYEWIDRSLSAPAPAGINHVWKIVVGHWGIYSYAGNADTEELIQHLDPLLVKHKVHAYFNGHDHSLQHVTRLKSGRVQHYFVSGAGGHRIHTLQENARADPDLVHAAMTHGFMNVQVSEQFILVRFYDKSGEVLYTTRILH